MSEAATFVAADEPGALEIVGSNPTDPTKFLDIFSRARSKHFNAIPADAGHPHRHA